MSSQDQESTRRRVQPPTRYPEVELPRARPADASDTPVPAEIPPSRAQAQEVTSLPLDLPRVSTFPPMGPTPHDEGLSAPIARRTAATPEEVLLAHIRELDHALHEALNRLAEADHRISLMEAEFTRFRDTEFSPLKTRVAAMESLNTHPSSGIPVSRATQAGYPKQEVLSHENLPRESVDPKGRRGKSRPGKRDINNHEYDEHSESSSNPDGGSSSSDDSTHLRGNGNRVKGKSVPGLEEIVPSRSDYKDLVSYRTYRLADRSNRYNAAVTGKMSTYLKRVKHAISPEDRFSGDEPIEVLAFLRTFKEAADHNELSEGAAARLIPYFLTGAAKEGYRAHLDEAPVIIPTYPYMVQYLLETYALDDELSQAYMAVTTAKQAEKETEKSFGRRLHRLAIRAGNVIDKRDLTTIYVEGLPTFVQAGLRMHLTPGMSFETVQRLAHNLGVSLRQAVAQPQAQSQGVKHPFGVKALLPRPGSVLAVESQESSSIGVPPSDIEEGGYPELEANLATSQAAGGYVSNAPSISPSWRKTETFSPSPSVVSIPTRGWASPGGSVFSETPSMTQSGYPPRTGISKPLLCFLCYEVGHFLADCPRLPGSLQKEAAGNRAAYLRSQETKNKQFLPAADRATRSGDYPHRLPPQNSPARRGSSGVFELASPDAETQTDEHELLKNDENPQHGSENLEGGN
jgi:hypothetical protein